jgi:hypothetical protein
MIRTIERTSRKQRLCDGCGGVIPRGVRYRDCVASPGEDYSDPDHWSRLRIHAEGECFGGTGAKYELSLEVEWREHYDRRRLANAQAG